MTDRPSFYSLGQIPYLTSGKWKLIPKSRGGRSLSVQAMSIKQIQGKYAKHKYKETNAKVMKQVLGPEVSVRVYLHTCG